MVGWRYIRFVTLGGGSLLKRFSRLPPLASQSVCWVLDRCILRAASTRTVDSSFTCSF
eukprot:COSAG05_NODE_24720_length_227_cov_1106.109375_1_plen_57_part_01